jgi:hypothetical protein
MKGNPMTFRVSREQLAKRDALAAELRQKAETLNAAIVTFNEGIEPLARAVAEAQDAYNETLEAARSVADGIAEPAQEEFDAKSDRWQNGENGMRVRSWIEQWKMILDDIELELPEPLEEIDPEEHACNVGGCRGKTRRVRVCARVMTVEAPTLAISRPVEG